MAVVVIVDGSRMMVLLKIGRRMAQADPCEE